MSEKRKRNSYSPEFKAKVGLEAIHGVKTVNEIGQAYGVHPVQVGQWKKAILDQAGLTSDAKAVVFSLPVTSTAGMRLMEMEQEA